MDPNMLQLGRECHAKTSALEMIGHPSYGDTCALSHMSCVKDPWLTMRLRSLSFPRLRLHSLWHAGTAMAAMLMSEAHRCHKCHRWDMVRWQRSIKSVKAVGPYWTILDHIGPYWTILDHIGPKDSKFDRGESDANGLGSTQVPRLQEGLLCWEFDEFVSGNMENSLELRIDWCGLPYVHFNVKTD